MALVRTLAAVIAAVLLPVAVAAQAPPLPRLHISALGMRAEPVVVTAGKPFRLTIHVHLDEVRERIDELVLPTLTNALALGVENRRVAGPIGTDFYTTLTVEAQTVGDATFSPAYIDAIDPVSEKPLRFSSNAVTVKVLPPAPSTPEPYSVSPLFARYGAEIVGAAVAGSLVLVVSVVVLVVLGRRRGSTPAAPRAAAPAAAAVSDDPLRDAIAMVRARGDDASMDALRVVLFARAGARPGATLADALEAVGDRNPQLARTLEAMERTRFSPGAARAAATRDLLRYLYDYANGTETTG